MSESQVEALVEKSFAGINWNLFSEGQFFDALKNIIVGIIDDVKDQAGGEKGLEDMVLSLVKPLFDRWAASNRFPPFADSLFWNLLERAVRASI